MSDDDYEICETCDKKLRAGDMGHRCADGPVLCEECSPTFADIMEQYEEAKAAGTLDALFPFPEDAPDHYEACKARIAAGDGDKKNAYPL